VGVIDFSEPVDVTDCSQAPVPIASEAVPAATI